jgi:hypothetical protein
MVRNRALTGIALALTGAFFVARAPAGDIFTHFGAPELTSIGALAFGPDGTLLIGDTRGAQVFAVDVDDNGRPGTGEMNLDGVDNRIAQMLGTSSDEITIHDLAVHPTSHSAYMSVSRGSGRTDPVVMKVDGHGTLSHVDLDNVRFSRAAIPNAPEQGAMVRRRPARSFTITDLSFVGGEVYVAGLSNEEFASNLRRIPFPFGGGVSTSSLEIYHVSHGQDETHAPVNTFTSLEIDGQTSLLAAYTCTPLVQFPIDDLTNGSHVIGKTVAELGAGNRPLDIVSYEFDGQHTVLVANSRHPLMKMNVGDFTGAESLVNPTRATGVPFERLSPPGVVQLADLNDDYVLAIQNDGGSLNLRSIAKSSL